MLCMCNRMFQAGFPRALPACWTTEVDRKLAIEGLSELRTVSRIVPVHGACSQQRRSLVALVMTRSTWCVAVDVKFSLFYVLSGEAWDVLDATWPQSLLGDIRANHSCGFEIRELQCSRDKPRRWGSAPALRCDDDSGVGLGLAAGCMGAATSL
jgi:hypothetical protein